MFGENRKIGTSVIIIHYKRTAKLRRTLQGLKWQTYLPSEVIVVEMGEKTAIRESYPFQLVIVEYKKKWEHLPLAAARNYGAHISKHNILLFLDVDCIPSADYCITMARAIRDRMALVMATPRYLLGRIGTITSTKGLIELSVPHPDRPKVYDLEREYCYEMFWSLCFAIPKHCFTGVGGFSETYRGYGAEDTDFALKIKRASIPFYLSETEVYHQQHPIYIPPLNHLVPIVHNCNVFYSNWGYWPMEDCLIQFTELGYIDWEKEQRSDIRIVRLPNKMQIRKHLVKNAPYR